MKKILFLAVAALIASCSTSTPPGNKADDKTGYNKERMQAFYDQVLNAHNTALIDSFCTTDFVDHQADPRYPAGIPGLKAFFTDFFAAFPDLHFTTNWMMASGDTVVAHFTFTGTNNGPFMGMPATNKPVTFDGIDVVTIKDGKATVHWGYGEDMKMMEQLGMMGGAHADSTAAPAN